MPLNSTQYVCLNGVASALLVCAAASGQSTLDRQVVLLYNHAEIEPKAMAEAEAQASRIFREAGIELLWLNCTLAAESSDTSVCGERMKARPLMIKLVASAGTFPNRKSLAYAAVDSSGGSLAIMFLDRIQRFIRSESSCELGPMLGHVMAHEMGHLLLSMVGHVPRGIMAADWRTAEMRQLANARLVFTSAESARMRAEVKRRSNLARREP